MSYWNDGKVWSKNKKRERKQPVYTWQSPGGKIRNQIDYILVKNHWKTSIKSAKTLPGADIGSDHQLLMADVRIKLKSVRNNNNAKRFDLSHINEQYKLKVSNSFDALMVNAEEMTPDELWDNLKDNILEAAKKHIPTKKKKKVSSWLSQEVCDLADERRELKEAGLRQSNLYRKLSNEIQQLARRDKNDQLKHMCADIENHSSNNHSRNLYRCVKNLTSTSTARLAVVKNENGQVLTESDEIKARWMRYCADLHYMQRRTPITQCQR